MMDKMADNMAEALNGVGISWPADYRRIRYLCHIVYIAVTAFLTVYINSMSIYNDREAWRAYGCYGKLHNIVV